MACLPVPHLLYPNGRSADFVRTLAAARMKTLFSIQQPWRLRLDGIGLDDGSHRACNKVYFNAPSEPSTNQFEQGFLCEYQSLEGKSQVTSGHFPDDPDPSSHLDQKVDKLGGWRK